ncbi:MAG: Organic solvent tolerance protein OstA [Reichenbachiella sp.]
MQRISFLFIFIISLSTWDSVAQKKRNKIKYKAEKLTNVKEGVVRYKKLIDRVVFKQKNTIVYCDSAYYFQETNVMEAYGRVRIKDGDSVTITSRKLIYKGNIGMALLREDVVYRRGNKVLYTDFLDYNTILEIAEFSNDGKMVDENNTLTSNYGRFHSKINKAYFFKDVLLVAPDYNLKSDTLEYSTISKIAITKGPTYIENKDGTTVDADGGTFRTAIEQTVFKEGTIETKNYILIGDHIFIDDQRRFYTATGNVVMTSKKDDVIIFGEKGVYDKKEGISKVFGDPLMKRVMKQDTMFLSADTLVSVENADKDKERILAYHNILIYKGNLQGKCDSLSYFLADSTMKMFEDPILWNLDNQMEADSIDLNFKNDVIHKMKLRRNSFLTSVDTMGQYNQIKGRNMIGLFDSLGNISTMDVKGNGESHYFVLEGDSLFIGMNKIYCSSMRMVFVKNQLDNITFYKNPEAQFIPPHELVDDEIFLDDFDWRDDERPELHEVATYYQVSESADDQVILDQSILDAKPEIEGEIKKEVNRQIKSRNLKRPKQLPIKN